MCVGTRAVTHMWRSEDNCVKLVLTSTFALVPGTKLRLPDLCGKRLSHWAIPLTLDPSLNTSLLSECEMVPHGLCVNTWSSAGGVVWEGCNLHEVEPCRRKWVTGRWALWFHSLFYFLFALCFLTTDASDGPPRVPRREGLPNLDSKADERLSLPSLHSVFSSHSNKKSEHHNHNHLRVHVLAQECWKNINIQITATAVPIEKT